MYPIYGSIKYFNLLCYSFDPEINLLLLKNLTDGPFIYWSKTSQIPVKCNRLCS